jgi:hypothetical protein
VFLHCSSLEVIRIPPSIEHFFAEYRFKVVVTDAQSGGKGGLG